MLRTPCGLPLYCVSGFILYHATKKIKWFPALAAWYSSRSFGSSFASTPALAEPAFPGADVRAGACALISIQGKIRRRRADSDRGGARKRPAPVAVVRGHPEGKRRREPTRSKGPGICRKAGPGVNGRGAENPPLSRSVLPAVPATQTVKPAACQDPLCP